MRGGAQEATVEMFEMLKKRDVDVNVLTCQAADESFISDLEDLGITTYGVPYRRVGFTGYPDLYIEKHADLVKSSDVVWITDVEYLCAPRVKRIDKGKPVVAHITSNLLACPSSNASYGMSGTCTVNCSQSLRRFAHCRELSLCLHKQYYESWSRQSRKMKIYRLLSFPKSCVDFINWPLRRNQKVFESIDGFMALSEFTRDLIRIHVPQLKNAPIEVVPNPISMPAPVGHITHQDRSEKSILYASGSGVDKGPHIVLYATKSLLDQGFDELTLTMLGTEGNPWIRNLISRLQIEEHVMVRTYLPRTQVSTLMANSDVVLMPSLTPEALGRIPIEANLLGTPAVVSNRGALPSVIVDKVTGFVAEPTVEAFAKSTRCALTATWNRELIAQTARTRFDPERMTDKLVQTLKSYT